MPTTLYLTNAVSDSNDPNTTPSSVESSRLVLSFTRGTGLFVTANEATQSSSVLVNYSLDGTSGGTSDAYVWISPPLNSVTISGSITMNFWAMESNAMANVGACAYVYVISSDGSNIIGGLIGSPSFSLRWARGVEYGTSRTAQNWSGTPTTRTLQQGERIAVRCQFADSGGTQASGHHSNMSLGATTANVDGDSWITFSEDLTEAAGGSTDVPVAFLGGGWYGIS